MRERPTNPAGGKRTALSTQDTQNAVIRERRRIRRSEAAPHAKSQKVVKNVKRDARERQLARSGG
jgi:hypothetical protein